MHLDHATNTFSLAGKSIEYGHTFFHLTGVDTHKSQGTETVILGAIGAAVGVTIGCYRIVTGTDLWLYIIAAYVIVIIQTQLSPRMIIPLAYDSGGVTTSTVTVPLLAALGIGLASSIRGRNPVLDGFGLIAFASLLPILFVMVYGIWVMA